MRVPGMCMPRRCHPLRRSCIQQRLIDIGVESGKVPSCGTAGGGRRRAVHGRVLPAPPPGAGDRRVQSGRQTLLPDDRASVLATAAGAHLFGELRRVRGGTERLGRENSCGLMVLSAASAVRTHRDDDVGSERPDVAHEISEDLLPTPLLERLLLAERVSEVDRSRENAAPRRRNGGRSAIPPMRSTPSASKLVPDLVLTAIAARRRDEATRAPTWRA